MTVRFIRHGLPHAPIIYWSRKLRGLRIRLWWSDAAVWIEFGRVER